jgi:hypothetical protein
MIHETVAYINALIDGLGVFPVRYGITTLEQGGRFYCSCDLQRRWR